MGSLPPSDSLKLPFVLEHFSELVAQCIGEGLARARVRQEQFAKLAYTEKEAAALLSITPEQLRSERRIRAREIAGELRYARADLVAFLERR